MAKGNGTKATGGKGSGVKVAKAGNAVSLGKQKRVVQHKSGGVKPC